jgi:adenylate cyclase
LNDAATKAITRSAYRDAIGFLEEALSLADSLAQTPETLGAALKLRMRLGPMLRASKGDWSEEAERCYAKALALSDRLGESQERFSIVLGLWACHQSRGQYEAASAWTTQLLELADKGDDSMRLHARCSESSTAIASGRPAQALPELGADRRGRPERFAWNDDSDDLSWHGMYTIGTWLLGHFVRARQAVVRGVYLARQSGSSATTALANHVAAVVHFHRGERGAAMLHARVAFNIEQAYGVMNWPEHASIVLARVLAEDGHADEALRLVEAGLPRALCAGWSWAACISFGLAADVYRCVGQPGKGLDMLRTLDPERYHGLYGPELHRLHAGLLMAAIPGTTDEAESHLREAKALAHERRMKALELRAGVSLARLLAPRDRHAAREALSVVNEFPEGLDVIDLRTARRLREWLR